MQLHNLKDSSQQVSFVEAVKTGLGRNQGVFFPESLTPLTDVDALLDMDFVTRSSKILSHLMHLTFRLSWWKWQRTLIA